MYAILQQSGHQYRVSPGDRLLVDRLAAEVGSIVALEPVVLVQGDEGAPNVGAPVVDGVRVAATVVSHPKGGKIRVFKYKAKKRYRRTHGHRSLLTELRVEAVLAAGEALPEPKVAEAAPAKAAKPARSRAKAKAEAPVAEVAEVVEADVVEVPEAAAAAPAEAAPAPDETAEESPSPTTKARTRSKPKAAAAAETTADDSGAQGALPAESTDAESETPKRRARPKKSES
jgi:large subunit ribosomal protein L21